MTACHRPPGHLHITQRIWRVSLALALKQVASTRHLWSGLPSSAPADGPDWRWHASLPSPDPAGALLWAATTSLSALTSVCTQAPTPRILAGLSYVPGIESVFNLKARQIFREVFTFKSAPLLGKQPQSLLTLHSPGC